MFKSSKLNLEDGSFFCVRDCSGILFKNKKELTLHDGNVFNRLPRRSLLVMTLLKRYNGKPDPCGNAQILKLQNLFFLNFKGFNLG